MKKNLPLTLTLIFMCLHFGTSAQKVIKNPFFGNNGKAAFFYNYESVYLLDIDAQFDKTLVTVAGSEDPYYNQGFVVRLNANGTIDSSFAAGAGIIYGIHERQGLINFTDVMPDGRFVIYSRQSLHYDWPIDSLYLQRFLPDGTPDSSFGENGNVYFAFPYTYSYPKFLEIKPNGKILAGAYIDLYSKPAQFTTQLNADGSVNSNFGNKGMLSGNLFPYQNTIGIKALEDNTFIEASSYLKNDNTNGSLIVKYRQNGKIDSSFGLNGVVLNNNTLKTGSGVAFAVQNKKILEYTEDNGNAVIFRYNANGTADNSFGINGKIIIANEGLVNNRRRMEVQRNGRIIINLASPYRLKRFLPDGSPDSSFGKNSELDVSEAYGSQFCITGSGTNIIIAGLKHAYNYNDSIMLLSYIPCLNCNEAVAALKTRQLNKKITIYPNPVTNSFTIYGLGNARHQLQLTDASGRLLQHVSTTNDTYTWQATALKPGIYFVKAIADDGTTSMMKVIK